MNIRRFRVLHEAGATYAEIALECDVDWRTVRKYLSADGLIGPPPAPSRAGTQPQVITPFVALIEAWLRVDITLRASVIHERLVADHGFTGHYQRVKMHLAKVRPVIADELTGDGQDSGLRGLHRRFEVIAGAQAQVDWGEEGDVLAAAGIARTYSFHMVLSFSPRPVHLLHVLDGPGDVLGLPPPGVRALRWRSGLDRLRPDQDRHQAPCRPRSGRSAASGGGGVRRALRLHDRPAGGLPPDR